MDAGEAQKVTRIEPGMIADIGESDIVFAQPSSQSKFAPAYLAGMQAMAAGAGITYDQLTGDLRQANYSSCAPARSNSAAWSNRSSG
jgi:capsid protein